MATAQMHVAISRVAGTPVDHVLRRFFPFSVFLGALLLAGVFACARLNPPDPDVWWHLAVGEQILQRGLWPTSDPYSFTVAGHPWIAYEWLGELLIAGAGRLAGMSGLTALLILLSSILFLLLYYACDLRSGSHKAAFAACATLLPAAAFFFTLRPQLIGYIFLLITLICLKRFRQGRQRSVWVLPVVFLFWVNTHGSFAFGLFAVGLYWAGGLVGFRIGGLTAEPWRPEQRRHLAAVFLLCVLALTVTPYGTRPAAYPLEMALLQSVNIASIQEWQPLSPDLTMGKVFIALLLSFVLLHLFYRPTYRLEELALLLLAVYAASVHRRFLLLLLLVLAPFLAMLLARWMPPYQPRKDRPVLNVSAVGFIAAGVVLFFPSSQALQHAVTSNYPEQAVFYLRSHGIHGRLLNEYGWGGYLIWSRGTEQKVFIDGRTDIYDYGGVLSDYMSMTHLEPNTQFLLQKYNIQACLLRRDAPLATLLAALPSWKKEYEDSVSVLYVLRSERLLHSDATEVSAGHRARQARIIFF